MNTEQRIKLFHDSIVSGNHPNAGWLAKTAGISYRQAQRDIEYLQKKLGAPAVYDFASKGYVYSKDFTLGNSFDGIELESIPSEEPDSSKSGSGKININYYSATVKLLSNDDLTYLEKYNIQFLGNGIYNIEFGNIDDFIFSVFLSGAQISIVKPEWLRDKVVGIAEKIIKNNT